MGRGRYARRDGTSGYRNGYENGRLKTAEGVLRVQVAQGRGREEPSRSQLWRPGARTSEVRKRLIVERYAGGMAQRDMEYGLEKAGGQFVLSQSTVSELSDTVTQEYAAFGRRDWRGDEVAYRLIAAVYEPLRRWGSKTGGLCVWAVGVAGRQGFLSLSTANSESQERCLEVWRDLLKRGLQTPVPITTDGAVGLTKAIEALWPRCLRLRWWVHKRQNLGQKGPPQAWPEGKALGVAMREAPTVAAAERRRQALGAESHRDFPAAWRGLLDEAQASLPQRSVPPRPQPYGRPSHLAERAFEEERRRTKVIPPLWDDGGLVKLVFAVLLRVSARWGQKGLSEFAQQQIRSLRRKLALDEHQGSISDPKPDSHPRRSAASAA